jgi:hypothetical protein
VDAFATTTRVGLCRRTKPDLRSEKTNSLGPAD